MLRLRVPSFDKTIRAKRYIETLEQELILPKNHEKHLQELMHHYNRIVYKSRIAGLLATIFGILAYMSIITANLEKFGGTFWAGLTRPLDWIASVVGGSVCLGMFIILSWLRNIYVNDGNIMAAHIISHAVVHGHMRHRNGERKKPDK